MNDPLIPIITNSNQITPASARIDSSEAHLCMSQVLELLAADMSAYPERTLPVEMRLVARVYTLVGQVDVDLDAPLLA